MSEELYQVGADPIPEPDEDLLIRPEEMGIGGEDRGKTVQVADDSESEQGDVADRDTPDAGQEQGEEEKEEAAQPEPEPVAAEPEPEPEPVTVPKARLDKALRDKRALEQRLQMLEQQQQQQQPPAGDDVSAPQQPSNKDIAEALLDGDLDRYAELMEQRDVARDKQLLAQMQDSVPKEVSAQHQRADFERTRDALEERYPILDVNSDTFDAELTETVVDMALAYAGRGYSHAEALQMAADKVLRYEHPEYFQQAPAPVDPKVEKLRQERADMDRKLSAAAAQSPRTTSMEVDNPNTIPDFGSMSDEDFDKYTPAQIDEMMKRMREQRMG